MASFSPGETLGTMIQVSHIYTELYSMQSTFTQDHICYPAWLYEMCKLNSLTSIVLNGKLRLAPDQTACKWSPQPPVPKLTTVLVTLLCDNLFTWISSRLGATQRQELLNVEHVSIPSAHRGQ